MADYDLAIIGSGGAAFGAAIGLVREVADGKRLAGKAQEAAGGLPGTDANARTGKVPNARRRGGVAVKRAPVAGTRSRPVRGSTTGIPAGSNSACAGRDPQR